MAVLHQALHYSAEAVLGRICKGYIIINLIWHTLQQIDGQQLTSSWLVGKFTPSVL